jgi:hypothetical protein
MNLRKHRKYMQVKVRHGNAFNWALEKMIRRICASYKNLDKAFEEAYAKARNERQLQQE